MLFLHKKGPNYMLYTIKNEQLEITISTLGAEIKSVKYLNEDRLHDSNPQFWGRSAPLLFPNVGTILNKSTIINGQSYPLPKHGFLRDTESTIKEITKTSLILEFTSSAATLKMYPFDFKVTVAYALFNNQISSEVKIQNLSPKLMPFNFGLHPAFKTPVCADEKFEDYQISVQTLKNYDVLPVNLEFGLIDFNHIAKTLPLSKPLPLNYEDYQADALVFDNIEFNSLSLTNKKETKGLTFTFDQNFTMLGIWTPYPVKAPFICLEPWIGCADPVGHDGVFTNKKDLIWLKPNETKNISYNWKFF